MVRFTAALLMLSGTALAADSGVVVHSEQERSPALAVDAKGQLHLVAASVAPEKQSPDIFYSSSADGGKAWGPRVNVSGTTGWSSEPQIATGSHGEVLVVWTDTSSGEDHPDIFASVSLDGGKTWRRGIDVSNTPGRSSEPTVTVTADGTFHALWIDTTPGQPEVFHSQSSDQGLTWSKAENLSRTPGPSNAPAIASGPKGELAVAWADTDGKEPDIWFTMSTNGGRSWDKPVNLSKTPGTSANPSVALDEQGTVYVTWSDAGEDRQPEVFFLVSRDHGRSFERFVNISRTPGKSVDPQVAASRDGLVAVVWADTSRSEEAPDVWLASSKDGGRTFAAPSNVSNTPELSGAPDVVIANGRACSVWDETEHGATHLRFLCTSL